MVSELANWSDASIVRTIARHMNMSAQAVVLVEFQEPHEPAEYGYEWVYRGTW